MDGAKCAKRCSNGQRAEACSDFEESSIKLSWKVNDAFSWDLSSSEGLGMKS